MEGRRAEAAAELAVDAGARRQLEPYHTTSGGMDKTNRWFGDYGLVLQLFENDTPVQNYTILHRVVTFVRSANRMSALTPSERRTLFVQNPTPRPSTQLGFQIE